MSTLRKLKWCKKISEVEFPNTSIDQVINHPSPEQAMIMELMMEEAIRDKGERSKVLSQISAKGNKICYTVYYKKRLVEMSETQARNNFLGIPAWLT